MSLNKEKFLMATPTVTRVYTPGSHHNSRRNRRDPPRCEMRSDSPALLAEQSPVPIIQDKWLYFLLETPEIP